MGQSQQGATWHHVKNKVKYTCLADLTIETNATMI